jgi:hypothetical protein
MGNKIVRSVAPKTIFADAYALTSTTADFEQCDLMVYDATTKKIIKPAAEADCATFLGVAQVAVVDGKIKSPYQGTAVDAAQAIGALPGPVYGVEVKLVLKTGDALNPGDLVYADPASGARHVQAAGTKAIGVYQGAAIASAVAGQEIIVLVGARYPLDTLKF